MAELYFVQSNAKHQRSLINENIYQFRTRFQFQLIYVQICVAAQLFMRLNSHTSANTLCVELVKFPC